MVFPHVFLAWSPCEGEAVAQRRLRGASRAWRPGSSHHLSPAEAAVNPRSMENDERMWDKNGIICDKPNDQWDSFR